MSRSIKKGPFAAPELLKRVDEMNKAGDEAGPQDLVAVLPPSSRPSSDTPSLFTTAASMFPCT